MIKDFADKRTAAIFHGVVVKEMDRSLQEAVRVKLVILNNAMQVDDLRLPPSNRLEKLAGDRQGQWKWLSELTKKTPHATQLELRKRTQERSGLRPNLADSDLSASRVTV